MPKKFDGGIAGGRPAGGLCADLDASHVGMIVGRNAAGKLLVCHCSSGMNNIVVTEFTASGFTAVGRQALVPG